MAMKNKDKFLALVSTEPSDTLAGVEFRIKNREMLRAAQHIALKVLERLDELKWTHAQLDEHLGDSEHPLSDVISGKVNLTLATLVKLESVLNISILQDEDHVN